MPYPELTLTLIGSMAAIIGLWSMLILERILVKRKPDAGGGAGRKSVLVTLALTAGLGGLGYAMYSGLQAKQTAHFVALGHRACHSWSFASAIPPQSFAATIMGRYEGVAGYTCADVSEHFFNLASGLAVKEPPGFYGRVSAAD